MSPLFGRKKKKEETADRQDVSWVVYEATYDDAPLVIRSNQAYLEFKDRKKFGFHAGVAIGLNDPRPGGLPDEKEEKDLMEVETGIETYICQDGKTLFVTALTTGTMKELVFYTSDPDTCRERLGKLKSQMQSHTIDVVVEPDENWDTYFNFIP